MGTARIFFAGAVAFSALVSAAFADDDSTGVVTQINRLNSTIAIQQVQNGTVGAGTGGPIQEFKAKDEGMLESVHAGDRVSFSTTDSNGAKTITKLQKAK